MHALVHCGHLCRHLDHLTDWRSQRACAETSPAPRACTPPAHFVSCGSSAGFPAVSVAWRRVRTGIGCAAGARLSTDDGYFIVPGLRCTMMNQRKYKCSLGVVIPMAQHQSGASFPVLIRFLRFKRIRACRAEHASPSLQSIPEDWESECCSNCDARRSRSVEVGGPRTAFVLAL